MTLPKIPTLGAELTLTEAAAATGISRSTIKRHLGEFQHKRQGERGSWLVPVQDLIGAGFKLRPWSVVEAKEPVTPPADLGQSAVDLASVQAKVLRLTEELAAAQTRAAVAEAKVSTMAANLDDLRLSLRAIAGAPVAPEAPAAAEPIRVQPAPVYEPQRAAKSERPVPISEPPRRRWLWSRSVK